MKSSLPMKIKYLDRMAILNIHYTIHNDIEKLKLIFVTASLHTDWQDTILSKHINTKTL